MTSALGRDDTARPQHQHRCPFCGHPLRVVEVHGHGQCAVCCTNLQPCCDGERCAVVVEERDATS
jgi:hypothetical protein